ncbi:tRNA 5-methylaminomethyl-2-thiouridine synthase [Bradyrhizobium sp. UFLA05-153]
MPEYYFSISNGKPYRSETGEELRDDRQAWKEALRLVRDVESALDPDGRWDLDVSDEGGLVYSIKIKARKHR